MGGRTSYSLVAVATALAFGGCAVGPNFKRPAAPDVAGYTSEPLAAATASAQSRGGESQRFVQDRDIPGDWWTLFHSDALNRLIEQALRDNPDFDAAQAALRKANENVYARQGALFPSVTAGIQSERERLAGAVIGEPQYNPTFSVTTASLNVSYAPDVLGGTRRQIESLAAQAEYQRFALEATYLTLTSNLVVTAVQEAALRAQIAATEQILGIENDELNLIRERFRVGVVSQADVLLQEATLDQTRATLPPLRKQLAQVRNELTALVGRLPSQEVSETFDLDSLTLPQELPVSLPSELVEQRPDVRGAEAELHAASAGVGIAIANQLPQFAITGDLGRTMTGFPILPGTGVWSIAGSVGQTLFDAGTLLHEKRAAVAALDQAAAQYRSTVIKAFQNVADALRALQSDADDLAAQDAAERSSQASLELARRQFHAETIDYLTVLTAERTWQQARIARVQAEGSRYADTAALFQALGGGWWHRTDVSQRP
ncbi:MAG TPA: efflux transporter outer membrane subunit [Steroidobacteraceae bacterium]|nr:efflux transporter outer membrane subunit [Steroidobacteraceae bacterium]